MEEKKIKITIEVSPLLANCLQRMLVEEMENQERWSFEEERDYGKTDHKLRERIIENCEEVREQLANQGFPKYFKCR